VACTTTVAWRRRSPVAAVLVALAAVLVYQRLSHDTQGVAEPPAIVLCFYTLARTEARRGRRGRLALLLGYALAVATATDAGQSGFSVIEVLLTWVPLAVLPAAAGLLVERHRALNARLADTAARLQDEQVARAEQATVLERNRVARELHDVVAHSVSVMVIQAGAARLLAPGDVSGARGALALVVCSGGEALGDLRRVMGVLRREDELTDSPRPGVATLDRLIEPVRATGLEAGLLIDGQPFPLPAEVDLVAYRVVQEALTNSARYAGPGPATVRVRYQPGAVELEISDTGQGLSGGASQVSGSGHGLIGMRERVEACGGQLQAGLRPGGFRVWARLPAPPPPDSPAKQLPERLSRARAWLSRSSDVLFAAASLVVLEAAAVSYSHQHGWLWLNGPAVAVMAAAALWRRRMPLLFLVLVAAAGLAAHGLVPANRATLTGTYVLLVPAYTLGAWASRCRTFAGLALWLAGSAAVAAAHHTLSAGLAAGALMAGLAWSAGLLVRRERDLAQQLRRTTGRLQAEREQRAQLAIAQERARLARQLQNQVAQLVVAMLVQAQAAAKTLADDPGRALDAIRSIETTGRDALDQMRHILGVLRSGSRQRELQPQPGLAQLHNLVQRSRDRGQPVNVRITGQQGRLLGGVDLAAYRIIEEVLALAGDQPAHPVTVCVRYTDEDVEVEFEASLAASAWPTESIRERLAICHGALSAPSAGQASSRLAVRLPRTQQGALR
jgi:signal transduction histidine kinase